jgi:competence protein ComEC
MVAATLGFASWWPLVFVGGLALAFGLVLSRRVQDAANIALISVVAALALFHYSAMQPAAVPGSVAAFNDGAAVEIRGMVTAEPSIGETTQQLRVRVDAYRGDDGAWVETGGSVLVTARPFPQYKYGDIVELGGELTTPARLDAFDYREYLARQGIGSVSLFPDLRRTGSGGGSDLKRAVISLRRELSRGIEVSMPEPEASLATGILLGNRDAIPDDVTEDFNRSGISHLIAISGANMLLVAAATIAVLWRLIGRRPAILVSMLVIVLYAVLVGGSPSVLRATVMGVVVLGAQLAGRPGNGFAPLVLTVAVLTAWAPGLADSVSFQLSVFATAGIVLFATPLAEAVGRLRPWLRGGIGGLLVEQGSMTLMASIAVLPIMARAFGEVSLVSLPANLLAGPVFVAVIPLSAVSAFAGWMDTDLGRALGEATQLPITVLVTLARIMASPSFAVVRPPFLITFALALGLLGGGRAVMRRFEGFFDSEPEKPAHRARLKPFLAIAAVIVVLAVFLFAQALTPHSSRLQVTVLDVGQGDAILIEAPDGQVVLIDGGPSVGRLLNQLGAALPAAEHRIDLVVLSHPQEDHVAGLAGLFDRYDVGAVLAGPREGPIPAYHAFRNAIEARDVPLIEAQSGLIASLGDEIELEVLNPPPEGVYGGADELNENSVVLRLVYRDVSFLLTGDLGFVGEHAVMASGLELRSTVLKVGHHGSDGSTSPSFLDAVAPDVAVISDGAQNSFGHPSPTTRLRLAGVPTWRTDLNGRVSFETDGRHLWVEGERGAAELVPAGQAER